MKKRNLSWIDIYQKHKIKSRLPKFCARCKITNKELKKGEKLQIHHIIPISEGGLNTLENMILLCPKCHIWIHKIANKRNLIKKWKKKNLI